MKPRVLFILKQRIEGLRYSNGLLNSVRFVVEMLNEAGVEAKAVTVVDNNGIHKEVHDYQPTHVIIEALWVVPEKFDELFKYIQGVKWVIRGHSEIPFLAGEGVAIDWICRYLERPDIAFACNSITSRNDIRRIVGVAHPEWSVEEIAEKVLYLPNYYPAHPRFWKKKKEKADQKYLDVACFGAIRPLKNQLLQAVAALEYADIAGKTLRFHVNGTRCEQGGESILRNLRALFFHAKHQLVEHDWMNHQEFKELLTTMDIGLQVSFSETFNIVAADMAVSGLPVVGSPEITWLSKWCQANPSDSEDIFMKIFRVMDWRLKTPLRVLNLRGLRLFCDQTKTEWLSYLEE